MAALHGHVTYHVQRRRKIGCNPLQNSPFTLPDDTGPRLAIWSFASPKGFVIRCRSRTIVRLFLGSSAVEHSTVNRMVAGSNPARGASYSYHPLRHTRSVSTSAS